MWRSTFPFLLRTAASRWGAVVAVVVGGLVAGAHASQVVVLGNHGKVLEQGSPTDLAEANGVFAALLHTARSELDIRTTPALQR